MSSEDNKKTEIDNSNNLEINKIINNKESQFSDEFFEKKFNLNLSENTFIKQKKSSDLLDEIKKNDQNKQKRYEDGAGEDYQESEKAMSPFAQLFKNPTPENAKQLGTKLTSEKQTDLILKNMYRLRRFKAVRRNYGNTFAMISHGKLGVDNFFLLFGLLGVFFIPYYFWNRQKKRANHLRINGIDPQIIENLDENSDIDIDDVSYHWSFFPVKERRENIRKEREKEQMKQNLIQDVYGNNYGMVDQLEKKLNFEYIRSLTGFDSTQSESTNNIVDSKSMRQKPQLPKISHLDKNVESEKKTK